MNLESEVRCYCRDFPVRFVGAKGCFLYDKNGKAYYDFLCGAGALNYGHGPERIRRAMIDYLSADKPLQSLDLETDVKDAFMQSFYDEILAPRGMQAYKFFFCGPTGTNAVEAALKLAVSASKRKKIVAFQGDFHGVTTGSLAVSSNPSKRAASAYPLPDVTFFPFPEGDAKNELAAFEAELLLGKAESDLPAAVIFETVQAEGGVRVAPDGWVGGLLALCRRYGVVTICDDVQVGCGRTGTFFSFEKDGVLPDLVALSKSVGGGMPLAFVLVRKELDVLGAGVHNGTFRGNQLAFVAGKAALSYYREGLTENVKKNEAVLRSFFYEKIRPILPHASLRGAGLIYGVDLSAYDAEAIRKRCFENGLIAETCGNGNVLKLLPPLVVTETELIAGLEILRISCK